MIVDNFKLIRDYLTFNNQDEFYFLQVLIRGKDGHTEQGVNGNNKNRVIKIYTIRSEEELDKVEPDIKKLCSVFNARAYIHPTKRSFKDVAVETLKVFSDLFSSENFESMKRLYATACGKSYIHKDKKFIVDIDNKEDVEQYIGCINFECKPDESNKVELVIPTVSGFHLICKPFDTSCFLKRFNNIDIHKNNPTLLYYEKN